MTSGTSNHGRVSSLTLKESGLSMPWNDKKLMLRTGECSHLSHYCVLIRIPMYSWLGVQCSKLKLFWSPYRLDYQWMNMRSSPEQGEVEIEPSLQGGWKKCWVTKIRASHQFGVLCSVVMWQCSVFHYFMLMVFFKLKWDKQVYEINIFFAPFS